MLNKTCQVWRAGQRVRLSASGLAVAEAGRGEPVDSHVDQTLDSGVVQDVGLTGLGLEDDVERERLHLLALGIVNLQEEAVDKSLYLGRYLKYITQSDQIGRFIALWATFQSMWQQLFFPNCPDCLAIL